MSFVCLACFLQGGLAVLGVEAQDEIGKAIVDGQVSSDISRMSWNSCRYALQVS